MSGLLRWLKGNLSSAPARTRWSWVAPWLLVGPALDRAGYSELVEQGVTHVVDLRAEAGEDPRVARSLGMRWLRIPILDRHPPTDEQFELLSEWLKTAGPGHVLYIHCQGGLERSPTLAIALLTRAGYELAEARAAVVGSHPWARPTPAQEEWLIHITAAPRSPAV